MPTPLRTAFLIAAAGAACNEEPPLAFEGGDCAGLTMQSDVDPELLAELQRLAILGSGKQAIQHRDLPVFTVVCLSVPLPVRVKAGTSQDVILKVDDNIIESIQTRVVGGRLVVESTTPFRSSPDSEVEIHAQGLRSLTLHGNGRVEIGGASGDRLRLQSDGIGSITAYGGATRVDAVVRGAGIVDAGGVKSQHARAMVEGVGTARVAGRDRVDATVKGMGAVEIVGKTRKKVERLEGFGRVTVVE